MFPIFPLSEYVFVCMYMCIWASHMVLVVKNLPANAEDIRVWNGRNIANIYMIRVNVQKNSYGSIAKK